MKTIRIYAIPSHGSKERTSGVDFARVIQPMKALNGWTDGKVKFKVDILDPNSTISAYDVAQKYDIVFMNYIIDPWGFAELGAMVRKFNKKIIFDMDDSLWDVLPDNQAYNAYKKGSEGSLILTDIINEVDYVTTTSNYLKNVIMSHSYKTKDKMKVFPNYIDLELYNHRSTFKNTQDITLLHFGSTTHFIDLSDKEFADGIDMILKKYPNVKLKTVGALLPKYKQRWGMRYEHGYGDTDVYKWIKDKFPGFMDEADILVTPLDNNLYTRCKSAIKWLEGSSAVKPGVWQRIRQYEEAITDGRDGFLASTSKEWFDGIEKLILNKEWRKSMGEEAFKKVESEHQMKDHVKDYANFFKEMLDKD